MSLNARQEEVDRFLIATLKKSGSNWPDEWRKDDVARDDLTIERALYHGIAGLLYSYNAQLKDWPKRTLEALQSQSRAQAMWELRHKTLVAKLVKELASHQITPIFLKGTALAYDIYAEPYYRQRGDTDILVRDDDLTLTRKTLQRCGFELAAGRTDVQDPSSLQEPWEKDLGSGHVHEIDLHWRVMKGWALAELLTYEDAVLQNHLLPRLCEGAMSFGPVLALLHACVHCAQHNSSPYFVADVEYFGGNRLIWLTDIHLLAQSLSANQWDEVCDYANAKNVAEISLVALETVETQFGTAIPELAKMRLKAAVRLESKPTAYLLRSEPTRQAWYDFAAVPGWQRKATFLKWRLFPPEPFMRAKYPDLAGRPLLILYCRRISNFLRRQKQ